MIRVALIGDSAVGKTSLLFRYVQDTTEKPYICSIGIEFLIKTLNIDDTNVKMQIWDTIGQDRFRVTSSSYFRGIDGAIIVFDKTNIHSFENITLWLEQANKFIETKPKIIIGNKVDDIEHFQVEYHVAKQLANDLKMIYIETSALKSYQVDLAFETICREILISKPIIPKIDAKLGPSQKHKIVECCLL